MRTTFGLVLSAVLAGSLLTGCTDDQGCTGSSYYADLEQAGQQSPIDALDTWLGTDSDLPDPPDDGWIVLDDETRSDTVVITNADGDGWWVAVKETSPGGWIVDEATADASGCGDDLPNA